MRIDIQLLPTPPDPTLLSNRTVVVIDILRATSVMVHALSQGAAEIIPVSTLEEAFQRAKTFPEGSTLLGGERGSRKIEGFDLGNSPREYMAQTVKDKRLILTTTNGTRAFHLVASGQKVLVGSFFNISATTKRCLEFGHDLLIFASGNGGRFSLEDTVCGGMLIDQILHAGRKTFTLTDAGQCALLIYQQFNKDLVEAFRLSTHGRDLIERGFEEDLPYCAQIDTINIVPTFQDGVIRVC